MSTIPKQDTTVNKSSLIALLTALLLGWLILPLAQGTVTAVLFFVVVAFVILVLRLMDRSNALWVVIGVVIGALVGLLLPQLSSSALGGDVITRAFFVMYLVLTV